MLRLMKAFLNWISSLYLLLVLAHDFPENVMRWVTPKYKMSCTTQQIFLLIQQWGVGRGMSFRKDTASGDIFCSLFFSLPSKAFFGTAFTLGTSDLGHLYLLSPPIKAATECNSLAPYRHLKKTMHILKTVRHFSLIVIMRRSYLQYCNSQDIDLI